MSLWQRISPEARERIQELERQIKPLSIELYEIAIAEISGLENRSQKEEEALAFMTQILIAYESGMGFSQLSQGMRGH